MKSKILVVSKKLSVDYNIEDTFVRLEQELPNRDGVTVSIVDKQQDKVNGTTSFTISTCDELINTVKHFKTQLNSLVE